MGMSSFSMLVSALCLFSLACVAEGNLKNTCTDISFYDLIKYTDKSSKCCDTVLKEVCEDRSERVCRDITDFKCNTVAWAVCSSKFYEARGNKCELKYNDFEYKHCQETEHFETQIKMVPECKDVTKQSCVDIWETDHHGNKVHTCDLGGVQAGGEGGPVPDCRDQLQDRIHHQVGRLRTGN